MDMKIYVEYKVEKENIEIYKENLNIIHSFYDSIPIIRFELYRSCDDSNRFVEEVSFKEECVSIKTLKAKRQDFHNELVNKLGVMNLSIFTFKKMKI